LGARNTSNKGFEGDMRATYVTSEYLTIFIKAR